MVLYMQTFKNTNNDANFYTSMSTTTYYNHSIMAKTLSMSSTLEVFKSGYGRSHSVQDKLFDFYTHLHTILHFFPLFFFNTLTITRVDHKVDQTTTMCLWGGVG